MAILDMGLTADQIASIDTTYPVLESGAYLFRITSVDEALTQKGKRQLKIKLELEQAAKDTKGHEVKPGYVITDFVSLEKKVEPNGDVKYDPVKRLVQVFEQILGARPASLDTDLLIGKTVVAQVKYVAETTDKDTGDTYPEKNQIGKYITHKS